MNFSLAGNILSSICNIVSAGLLGVIVFAIWVYYTRALILSLKGRRCFLKLSFPKTWRRRKISWTRLYFSLHQMGREQNPYARFLQEPHPRFSLEITGDGESIRSFHLTEHEYKESIQTAMGAIPESEVTEALIMRVRCATRRREKILFSTVLNISARAQT